METNAYKFSDARRRGGAALQHRGRRQHLAHGDSSILREKAGKTSNDVDANEVIWQFFAAHKLAAPTAANP